VRAGETVELPEVPVEFGGPEALDGERFYRAVCSPVREGDGSPGGVLATVIEATEDVRRRRGLERELERERHVAETLQRTLLPDALPELAGIDSCARYEPGGEGSLVGGDWYDVFDAGDGRVAIAVGDVAGRGLPAATVMGQLRAALRAYAIEDPSPAAVLARMDELVDRLGGSATLAYGLLDPRDGRLLQGLAGHPPPLLVAPGGDARFLATGLGTPLGAPAAARTTAELVVPDGGLVLYYTDGLLQERELGIQSGLDRLREAAARAAANGAELGAVCAQLLDARIGGDDDRALLAVRRT
jgi:serine phosphatase RsbU (regulator of sigma subunit)